MTTPFITIKDLCMDFPANPEAPSDTTPYAAAQESVIVLDNINLEIAD